MIEQPTCLFVNAEIRDQNGKSGSKSGGPDQFAARFNALVGRLPHVEARAKRDGVSTEELGRRRQHDSVPVLVDVEALLLANLHAVLPKSLLGQALARRKQERLVHTNFSNPADVKKAAP